MSRSIELFGPMTNLWKASNQGEVYLRFAKSNLTNIHSKKWQQNAHCDIFNEMSFDQVIDSYVDQNYMSNKCCTFQYYENSRMNRKKCT